MNVETILGRHAAAMERRRPLEPIWQACYDHVLPAIGIGPALFDATAADAAEQLAASLLAELTLALVPLVRHRPTPAPAG